MRLKSGNANAGRPSPKEGTNNGTRRFFAASVVLARRGRYAEAAKLLQDALDAGECSDAEALHLQARIYAQQGLHLHAESAWRKAQSLDSSNPAYAAALNRLRRARRPMGTLYRLSALSGGLALLLLLLWQIVLVNPLVDHRQDAATQSLSAIRGDIALLADGPKRRDLELAMALSKVQEGLHDLDTQLAERLGAMPTVEATTENRDEIIRHLDDRVAALEKATAQRAESIEARQTATDVAGIKRFDLIETAVSRI